MAKTAVRAGWEARRLWLSSYAGVGEGVPRSESLGPSHTQHVPCQSEVENRHIKEVTDTFTLVQVVDVIVVSRGRRKTEEGANTSEDINSSSSSELMHSRVGSKISDSSLGSSRTPVGSALIGSKEVEGLSADELLVLLVLLLLLLSSRAEDCSGRVSSVVGPRGGAELTTVLALSSRATTHCDLSCWVGHP